MTDCSMHTYGPDNYVAWHEWAEHKARTHRQRRCEECNLWMIWEKR